MKKTQNPQDLVPTPLTITLKAHIVRDLKEMEKNTKMPVDDLVAKALLMFIATHSDYMGRRPGSRAEKCRKGAPACFPPVFLTLRDPIFFNNRQRVRPAPLHSPRVAL